MRAVAFLVHDVIITIYKVRNLTIDLRMRRCIFVSLKSIMHDIIEYMLYKMEIKSKGSRIRKFQSEYTTKYRKYGDQTFFGKSSICDKYS